MKALSVYSGAGGMDVGAANAGIEIAFAIDNDPVAVETYRRNLGNHVVCGTVRDHLDHLTDYKGIDLLFGGPPCQSFSVAGKMDPNDPRSKELFLFFELIQKLQPKAFVMENVASIAENTRWQNVRASFKDLIGSGYNSEVVVLNATHFGVPQNRRRMFVIGASRTDFNQDEAIFKQTLSQNLEAMKKTAKTPLEVLGELGPAGSQANSRTCNAKITFAKNPVLRASPYAGMLFNGAGRPINPKSYAPTLPASMGGNKTPIIDEDQVFENKPSFVETYHQLLMDGRNPKEGKAPKNLRRLTIDECIAFQTFPTNYDFAGAQSAIYRQLGNAVPCMLAEAVFKALLVTISKSKSDLR